MTAYLGNVGLAALWSRVKSWVSDGFAAKSHSHGAGDVTSGTLPVERGGTGAGTVEDAKAALGVPNVVSPAVVATPPVSTLQSLAIGEGLQVYSNYNTAIGNGCYIAENCDQSTVLGFRAYALGKTSYALGPYAGSTGNYSVAVGNVASATVGNYNTVVGNSAFIFGHGAVALGSSATVNCKGGVAIGRSAVVNYDAEFGVDEKLSSSDIPDNLSVAIGAYSAVKSSEANVVSFGSDADYATMLRYRPRIDSSTGNRPATEAPYYDKQSSNMSVAVGLTRRLIHVTDPVDPQDAATKNYVDEQVAAASGGAAAADHVVAEGACDFWAYRMWASGVAECWGETGETSVSVTSAWGSCYYAPAHSNYFPGGSADHPFSETVDGATVSQLFCEAPPVCVAGWRNTGNDVGGLLVAGGRSATSTETFYVWAPVSTTTTGRYTYHAVGRWKE